MAGRVNAVGPPAGNGRRVILFGLVGVVNTATDFAAYAGFILLGAPPVAANGLAFVLANLQSYFLNGWVTFAKDGRPAALSLRGYFAFGGAHLFSLAASTLAVLLLSGSVGPFWAKGAATIFTFAFNYWSSARFAFRARPAPPPESA